MTASVKGDKKGCIRQRPGHDLGMSCLRLCMNIHSLVA